MLTDKTYFTGDLSLPNLDKPMQIAKIEESIALYEDEILLKVFGYPLFMSYKLDPDTDRFKDLITGDVDFTFTLDGKEKVRTWAGLQKKGQSFIACYVYYWHQVNNVTTTTGMGEVEAKTELSNRASITDKIVRAINKASDLIGQGTMIDNSDIESYQHTDHSASLFNYLLANKSTFPEWEFTPLKRINVYGF